MTYPPRLHLILNLKSDYFYCKLFCSYFIAIGGISDVPVCCACVLEDMLHAAWVYSTCVSTHIVWFCMPRGMLSLAVLLLLPFAPVIL